MDFDMFTVTAAPDAFVFFVLLALVAYGYFVGKKAKAYVERRKDGAKNADVLAAAMNAQAKRHLEQLERAQLMHIPLEPLRTRMAREDAELISSFTKRY